MFIKVASLWLGFLKYPGEAFCMPTALSLWAGRQPSVNVAHCLWWGWVSRAAAAPGVSGWTALPGGVVPSCLGSRPRPVLLKVPIHKLSVTGPQWSKELASECILMYFLLDKESLTTKKKNPFNNVIVLLDSTNSLRTNNERVHRLTAVCRPRFK